MLAVHRGQYGPAQLLIDSARDLLDTELTAMAGESYQRAYGAMVAVQMLAELEEVVQYKLIPERRPIIRYAGEIAAGSKSRTRAKILVNVITFLVTMGSIE